jgi:RNA polymerase sigma factor (sigma-70 family)
MADSKRAAVLRHLCNLVRAPAADRLPDQELVERFAAERDAGAFEALVRRHGPMVWSVCRQVLGHAEDAEDAFQATFFILARRAESIRKPGSVASWLHGVAQRTASQARAAAARRRAREHRPGEAAEGDLLSEVTWREVCQALHEELGRLAEVYGAPLVLCYLEGKTQDEAARELGWSKGTFRRRLERGRGLLRTRLLRRGLDLSSALLAAGLAEQAAPAAVPARLVAAAVAAVPSSQAAALAEAVLKTMAVSPFKSSAALVAALGLLGVGTGLLASGGFLAKHSGARDPAPPNMPVSAIREHEPAGLGPAGTDRYGDPLPPGALARMGTVRLRHGGKVEMIALFPDGRTLAAASRDQTLRLWDLTTGRELHRFPDHPGSLRFLALSPDGTTLASGVSPPGIIHFWEAASGKELRQLSPHAWLGRIAFSPDGKTLAAAAARHRILLWETATGRLLRELDGREETLFAGALAFAPDGRTLVSAGLAETIRFWDLATGEEERRLLPQQPRPKEKSGPPFHYGFVHALAFSPDGRTLASAAQHAPVRIWDVTTGREVRSLPGDRFGALSLAFSPDGRTLLSGEAGGMVRCWETATGKELRHFQAHGDWVSGLAFAPDGRTLVTSGDSTIRLWDCNSGREITPDRGHLARIISSALWPDGRTLLTTGYDHSLRRWDLATGNELEHSAALSEGHKSMILSPDGRLATCLPVEPAGEDVVQVAGVEVWDLSSRKKRFYLRQPGLSCPRFSPDGKVLFTSLWDFKERTGRILVLDTMTGRELRALARSSNRYAGIDLSPDGTILAATAQEQEKRIHLLDTATGKELCRVRGDREFLECLAISPENKLLAVADGPRPMLDSRVLHHEIHLWDIATGKEVRRFGRSSSGYWPVAFSPDGKTLTTADEQHRIHLWEVATGGQRLRLEGHTGQVGELLFAERGRTLVSTSSDTTALVWDLTGLRGRVLAAGVRQSARDLQGLWDALADDHATTASQALWDVSAVPREAVLFLRERLQPVPPPDPKAIAQLVLDLDSPVFAARRSASAELARLHRLAEPALRVALTGRPPGERKRRVQQLLEQLESAPSGELLRQLRAVEALEQIDTPPARQVLQALAAGASGALLTQQAEASLQRLAKRSAAP